MSSVLVLLRMSSKWAQMRSSTCLQQRSLPLILCRNASHRHRKEKSKKEMIKEIMSDPGDVQGFSASEELEHLTDLVENNFRGFHAEARQDEEKARRILKYKIIERKYFKKPQEQNLLTWDAKEQIRYLHQENPEEWTPEKIAESFPISPDGAAKLLRSTFVPHTMKDVIRHDKRVIRNWKLLKAGVSADENRNLDSGPVKSRYEALLQSGVLRLMENADGIKSLPSPPPDKLLAGKDPLATEKPGVFLSIVKDYTDKKKEKDTESLKLIESQREKISSALNNLTAVIERIAPVSKKSETGKMFSPKRSTQQVDKGTRVHEIRDNTSKSNALLDRIDGNFDSKPQNTHRSLHDELLQEADTKYSVEDTEIFRSEEFTESRFQGTFNSQSGETETTTKRKGLRRRKKDVKSESAGTEIDLGLEGTKVTSHAGENLSNVTLKEDNHSEWLENEISVERTPKGDEQIYLYDPDTGYQFPYGQPDIEEKIEVESTKKSAGVKMYRKDKDFYDADGEFLYRIP